MRASLIAFVLLAACKVRSGAQVLDTARPATPASAAAAGPSTCALRTLSGSRVFTPAELGALDDPIAQKVLVGADGCPTDFEKIMDKLRVTDAEACPDEPNGPPANTLTWFQSDRSQMLRAPDSYRYVTGRNCGDRSDHELLISNQTLSAVAAGGQARPMPHGMTIFGQSRADRSFNFYEPDQDNKWIFIGNSKDLLKDGYTCNGDGACIPKTGDTFGCNACHAGGGLNLMEQNLPWNNWEGGPNDTPGTETTAGVYKRVLGERSDVQALERIVREGNAEWQKARLNLMKSLSLEEALRPLFCTVDVNFQTSRTDPLLFLTPDLWLDPRWGATQIVPVDAKDYQAAILANQQHIETSVDTDGNGNFQNVPFEAPAGAVTDTFFPLLYAERSGQDMLYVNELVAEGVVDEDFVKDVLFVDFTRPTFSPTRCDLLKHAPKLAPAAMTPDAIRNGFKAALAAAPEPAAKAFLAALSKPNDAGEHLAQVNKFLAACAARPKAPLVKDAVAYASHTRNAARNDVTAGGRGLQVFPETLPFDSLADKKVAFDPVTCALR